MTERSPNAGRPAAKPPGPPRSGWLQVMNRDQPGRTIRLDKPVTRFGRAGSMAAMISRRDDGYYLCHLEGDDYPRVNRLTIDEQAWPLNGGDRIWMGGLEFRFLLGYRREIPAGDTAARPEADRQRHCSRVPARMPAVISAVGGHWDTRLIDISLSGALLEHPAGWSGNTGEHYTLGISRGGAPLIELDIEIRQIRDDRLGVAFHDPDETRRQQLRSLVDADPKDRDPWGHAVSERA